VRDGLASFALFALAMLAGEYTLSFGGYVLAIEAVKRRESIPRRMIGIASFALPALAYLATFAALHCGAHGTGFYRDPVRDFRVFASEVPRSVAILLGAAWAGLDIDAWMWAPGWQLALVATGVALALAVPIRRTLRELDDTTRTRATWMLLGSALSLVPLLAAEPSGRLLGVPTVGVSAIVALVVDHAWFPKTPQPRRGAAELTGLVALGLAFAHFVRGPLETWIATSTLTRSTIAYDERIAWVREHAADKSAVMIVRANVPPSILFTPLMLGSGARLRTLSYASGRFLLLRTGERTLELVAGTQPLFPMGPADMFRDFEFPLHVGDVAKLEGLRATVVQLRDDGTPRRLRYDFDRDLDDPSVLWIVEGDSGFREENPPAPGYGEPIMR
jgi:hypothetical protein